MAYLKNLKVLNTPSVKTYPAEIGNLTNLITININGADQLPSTISNLTQIKSLSISCRYCQTYPKGLQYFIYLKNLDLSSFDSKIGIPSEIWDMTSLESLDLSGPYNVTSLSPEIGN